MVQADHELCTYKLMTSRDQAYVEREVAKSGGCTYKNLAMCSASLGDVTKTGLFLTYAPTLQNFSLCERAYVLGLAYENKATTLVSQINGTPPDVQRGLTEESRKSLCMAEDLMEIAGFVDTKEIFSHLYMPTTMTVTATFSISRPERVPEFWFSRP